VATTLQPIRLAAQTTAAAPDRLSLAEVVAEAVARNPAIVAAQQRYDAARQRPVQERSLPDPMVSAGYNASGNPLPGAGLGKEPTANIGAMVSQELPYPGKRDLRASIASREADAAFQDIDAARLSIVARVKQAYYRLAYTYAVADVLNRNNALLDTLLKVSENRYAVGQAAQLDVFKAQTQVSILALQLERVRQERATREGELNALLNRPVTTRIGRPEDLQLTSFDTTLEALVAAATDHAPMLRRDQILFTYLHLAPDPDQCRDLVASGAICIAYETVTQPGGRVQEDFQMASTSVRLARLYRDTVLPQTRLALESSMTSYQTGKVDFISVLTTFGSVLEYEMAYFEELASFHTAVSRLEEMTGTPIVH